MKRRLEDTDDGFQQNPAKMLFTETDQYSVGLVHPTTFSPQQICRPVLTSTPQILPNTDGRRRLSPVSRGFTGMASQTNPAAESELRHVIDNFVSIYEQLDRNDNPDVKPNYSYSELAYLAMLRSQNFCLPIGQIYNYIQSRFKFFRNSTRKHWKNAVRHSLAKTMCFGKIPVGRGTSTNENLARSTYLWCILPNSIACFARGDYRATIDKESGTNTLRSAYFRTNSEIFWHSVGDYIATKMVVFRNKLETSSNPGLIFESQTCVFPWEQQKTKMSAQRRKVFQNIQNQQHIETNKQHGHCEFTAPSNFQIQRNIYSPEHVIPSAQTQTSNLNMYHAQTRSSSPVMRMPTAQPQNQPTYVERTPQLSDPWLPGYPVSSPEASFCSTDLDRATPFTSFECTDSGYVDCSANESSCKFLNSCEKVNKERSLSSPINEHFIGDNLTNGEYNFNQFDLSPFTLSDFSELSESHEHPRITPEKRPNSRVTSHVTPIVTSCVGQPMFISTPISSQTSRTQQCGFMYEPVSPMHNYGHVHTTTAPMVFVNSHGTYSTAMLPNWVAYS